MLFDRIFGWLYDYATHNKGLLWALVGAIALVSLIGLFSLDYSSDI